MLGVAYGGHATADDSTMIVTHSSNGEILNKGDGSIMPIHCSQGKANNFGKGSIVFGSIGYNGNINVEDNTGGVICGGVSDLDSNITNSGKISTNGQGTLTVGLGV